MRLAVPSAQVSSYGLRRSFRRPALIRSIPIFGVVSVYVWHDLSPEDGCSLVRFSVSAGSLSAVAKIVKATVPTAQNTTIGKLLRNGHARTASSEEQGPAVSLLESFTGWIRTKAGTPSSRRSFAVESRP